MGCKILPGNLTILQTMGWDVKISQGILQSYNPPHGMGCKIPPGNLTILQSYNPPHGMGCKILPGNLTIYKVPQCLQFGFVLYRFGEYLGFWEPRPSDLVNVVGFVNLNFQIR